MKVGILTFPHAPSIGAMLQMGALYHVIEELGHEVEVINYVSDSVNHKKKQKKTVKSIAIKLVSKMLLKSSKPSFEQFERKLKMFPSEQSIGQKDIGKISQHFDQIIVGSDQVWNPEVTGHDLNFYLKFCEDKRKKASYAASFGYMNVDEKEKEEIALLLNDFSYLGVREAQGQEIIKELTGRDSSLVLDPTLLVDNSYLMSEMEPIATDDKFVLFFCIKSSPKLLSIAKKYADKNGMKLYTVGGRIKDRFDKTKHAIYGTGPKEFLGLVKAAQCVFTNSFHGMAISIALGKDFFVEYSSDTNSRLSNLINIFQLQTRVIDGTVPDATHINYPKVNRIIENERRQSMNYLKSIFDKQSD